MYDYNINYKEACEMDFISVKDAAVKFSISERRVQKLCELERIEGAKMISGVWVIPETASKPIDERLSISADSERYVTLNNLCETLSISTATGRNWVKLGKLIPDHVEKKMPIFSIEYVNKVKKDIQTGENKALKSRRNKKYVSGNALYNSYVSDGCQAVQELQKLLTVVENEGIELTENTIQYLVADCALHLWADKNNEQFNDEEGLLLKFLQKQVSIGKHDKLIWDLICDCSDAKNFCKAHPVLFKTNYVYEDNEDVLGLIYISCKNIGNRKATGSYYTSTKVVKQLIRNLNIESNDRVLDPCCGTGNFLLQLPSDLGIENIYGNDIDKVSVKITRLNLALKFSDASNDTIYEHVKGSDYLLSEQETSFNHIIGNPPWGYEFSDDEIVQLKNNYKSAIGKNIESYDVFVEQALNHLKVGGTLSYVLPEAILNVKAHMPIRQYIIDESSIVSLDYLGNAFDGVQCPCIILQLKHTNKNMTTKGMVVRDGDEEFTIGTDRAICAEYFSFTMTDDEYCIIQKVMQSKESKYLLNNADFALGIVTGNNKEYISSVKTNENEMVLKGADICKYHINPTENYIIFKPESFQQIAPTEMYRAKEKLLYRFICNQLVFAYDDKQTLSLNSCNIVIPRIEGMQVKYILAILNSRVAQFIFKKQFNSVKVLRSHIESIPIPNASEVQQSEIVEITDNLIVGCKIGEAEKFYDILDEKIALLYGLSERDMETIKASVDGENKFLV